MNQSLLIGIVVAVVIVGILLVFLLRKKKEEKLFFESLAAKIGNNDISGAQLIINDLNVQVAKEMCNKSPNPIPSPDDDATSIYFKVLMDSNLSENIKKDRVAVFSILLQENSIGSDLIINNTNSTITVNPANELIKQNYLSSLTVSYNDYKNALYKFVKDNIASITAGAPADKLTTTYFCTLI